MKHTLLRRTSMLNAIGGIGKPPKSKSFCQSTRSDEVAGWSGRQRGSGAPGRFLPIIASRFRHSPAHTEGGSTMMRHDASNS